MEKTYLNMTDSAKYCGLTRRLLYTYIHSLYIGKPEKVAGHSVYNTEYLDEWMEEKGLTKPNE
jgi:predicted DNA-binding transcriptional regulator AlpA